VMMTIRAGRSHIGKYLIFVRLRDEGGTREGVE
jgi:hypothetical protein